jgi:hypothetical protein
VRLEGLGKLKKSNYLIGTRNRDLPACSILHVKDRIWISVVWSRTDNIAICLSRRTLLHGVREINLYKFMRYDSGVGSLFSLHARALTLDRQNSTQSLQFYDCLCVQSNLNNFRSTVMCWFSTLFQMAG